MAEQGGGRASWREAFQPLRNGAAFVSPSVLYKLLAKASTTSLATSEISPQEVWYRNIPSPPSIFSTPFPLSPQSLSSQFSDHIMLHFEFWGNVEPDRTCNTLVLACACSEISLQYVDQTLLLVVFRVFRVLHWLHPNFCICGVLCGFGN